MSKRFGRNQKRRLKAQIQSLSEAVVKLEAQKIHLEKLGARNRQLVEDTANLLGHHILTMPPQELDFGEHFSAPFIQLATNTTETLYTDTCLPPTDRLSRLLPLIELDVNLRPDASRNLLTHYTVFYGGEAKASYAFNPEALSRMPAELIAKNLAQYFLTQLLEN